jgi:DNA-binding transcriptional MerR regulator
MDDKNNNELDEIKEYLDKKFDDFEKRLSEKIDQFENQIEERLEEKLQDGLNQYGITVKYIKQYLSDFDNNTRPTRTFSQQTVVPRSISTYSLRQVPHKPWDPSSFSDD